MLTASAVGTYKNLGQRRVGRRDFQEESCFCRAALGLYLVYKYKYWSYLYEACFGFRVQEFSQITWSVRSWGGASPEPL